VKRAEVEVVGQEDEGFARGGIEIANAAERDRVIVLGIEAATIA
jgi:hypothetical protein